MIRKHFARTCLALALVLMAAAPCSAQGYAGPPGYGMGYGSPGYYLPGNYYGLPPINFSTLGLLPSDPTMAGFPGMRPRFASVRVLVPADARVWFDGDPTRQTGADRTFTTPDLPEGRRYRYVVRARWTAGGKTVTQTRTVRFHAGDRVTVDFLTARE
jgi:uncharacterized protein (TIGR03000 family)